MIEEQSDNDGPVSANLCGLPASGARCKMDRSWGCCAPLPIEVDLPTEEADDTSAASSSR